MSNNLKFQKIVQFIKNLYPGQDYIPLHEPRFIGKEKDYLNSCIDSTYVSSVGSFITEFEQKVAAFTGFNHAIATTNGTSALHVSLLANGVRPGDFVLCPVLTFVATANSIAHGHATPIFIDSAKDNLGMCPEKLEEFLRINCTVSDEGFCVHKPTGNIIRACVPMHVFGHVAHIEKIILVCNEYNIVVIEDAAEALGSFLKGRHVGHHGKCATLSFNGNKTITCGGGGMVITNDDSLARKIKHLTTTARVNQGLEFFHDQVGYNYRLPNINAALGCAQMEMLEYFLINKKNTAELYNAFFESIEQDFLKEPADASSNFWLYAIILEDESEKNALLKYTNENGVMTRPVWTLMNKLPMYKNCIATESANALSFESRILNIPSSVRVLK